jgi:predicted permease
MLRVDPQLAGYDNARGQTFFDQLKERAAQLPQVTSVALMTAVPMKTDTTEAFRIAPEGVRLPDDADSIGVRASRVDERFFETLGIRITRGPAFTSRDNASAPRVVIANETMARRYWPSESPIGKRIIMFAPDGSRVAREIVGVAADSKQDFILEDPLPFIYVPHRQMPASDTTVVVAARNDPTALAAAMRGVIHDLDPGIAVYGVRTMADLYHARAVTVANVIVQVVGAMGAMGLALALVGMYGLVAYAVSRRTREIGIRMAVGALPSMVLRMVLRSSTTLTIIGLAIGLIGSWATRQALRAGLAGLAETPFIVWLAVIPVVFAITLIAAYIPARRAARIDPLVALRTE